MAADDRTGMAVGLTCKDIRKSAKFYRDQLGFHMKESWPDQDNPMWANMVLDGQSVMVASAMDPDHVGEMCGGDKVAEEIFKKEAVLFRENSAGVGLQIYLVVQDVDAYYEKVKKNGVAIVREPTTQFYGIRELRVNDPDGYRLVFYTPVAMSSCQSCGMPLQDAQPGQMYCPYCTDESGRLRPYEQVFEGTVTGYFMGMQKMSRADAEKAAKEHLTKMPAWAGR